jgi:hypothetical protein
MDSAGPQDDVPRAILEAPTVHKEVSPPCVGMIPNNQCQETNSRATSCFLECYQPFSMDRQQQEPLDVLLTIAPNNIRSSLSACEYHRKDTATQTRFSGGRRVKTYGVLVTITPE